MRDFDEPTTKPCTDMKSACPVTSAISLIGGKWKLPVLYNLRERTLRFSELKKALPKITQKMLTQQLRELESDGLISRKVYAEVPPKVEYTITPIARKLEPVLAALCGWSMEYREVRKTPNTVKKTGRSVSQTTSSQE